MEKGAWGGGDCIILFGVRFYISLLELILWGVFDIVFLDIFEAGVLEYNSFILYLYISPTYLFLLLHIEILFILWGHLLLTLRNSRLCRFEIYVSLVSGGW